MSEAQTPNNDATASRESDQGLEEIDRLLSEEDPEFSQELEEVKEAEIPPDFEIESSLEEEEASFAEDDDFTAEETGLSKWKTLIGGFFHRRWVGLERRLILTARDLFIFLKIRPKEFFFYLLSLVKRCFGGIGGTVRSFLSLNWKQKFSLAIGIVLFAAGAGMIVLNVRGNWLPTLNPPILRSLSQHADAVALFNMQETISFSKAFPQDPEDFLFDKFKLNLRRTSGHPNPMGAFEIYAEVDSRETAIELQQRQVEFHDLIQRVMEGQSYGEAVSALGKERMKEMIKQAINSNLSQGWVVSIHFKTFILKP